MTAQPIVNSLDFARLQPLLTGGFVDAAVLRLRAFLDQARKVAPRRVPPDVVTMNSRVTLASVDGHRQVVTLAYPQEASAERGRVSVLAPLGRALLGARVGELVRVEVPGAAPRELRVAGIEYQPESAGDFEL